MLKTSFLSNLDSFEFNFKLKNQSWAKSAFDAWSYNVIKLNIFRLKFSSKLISHFGDATLFCFIKIVSPVVNCTMRN